MSGVTGLANAGMSLYENSELYKQNPNTPTTPPTTTNIPTIPATPQQQVISQNQTNPITTSGLNTQAGTQLVLPNNPFNLYQ